MSTDLHERTLSIETQPLDGDRLAVHAELRDVRHVDMPAYLGVSHRPGVVHHMTLGLELDRALTIVGVDASGALAGLLNLRPDQTLPNRASNPQVGSCHMWRADGPLASLEGSPNRRESV